MPGPWPRPSAWTPRALVDSGTDEGRSGRLSLGRGLLPGPSRHSSWRERIDLDDPLHVAALMVAAGEADACVAGATRPTPDVVRAALYCIGLAPGCRHRQQLLPSGAARRDAGDLWRLRCGARARCGAQLASIAVSTAATHAELTGDEPRVAMLSYSTKGSAEGPRVELVREATEIVRSRAPSLAVDGEMQFDAAWVPEVAGVEGTGIAGRGPGQRVRVPRPVVGQHRLQDHATPRPAPGPTGRCYRAPRA